MNNQQSYNAWSSTYDDVENKTRDLEKVVAQKTLGDLQTDSIIEIGCGTGKNTEWLSQKAKQLTAIDFSEQMLAKAKQKVTAAHVTFLQADITKPWSIGLNNADVATCSLILEHIENLDFIFAQVHQHLRSGGYFYIGELHPFKQYSGSKARFEKDGKLNVLDCFIHHISDYMQAATNNNFTCAKLEEWFDEDDRANIPRLVSFLFQKI